MKERDHRTDASFNAVVGVEVGAGTWVVYYLGKLFNQPIHHQLCLPICH